MNDLEARETKLDQIRREMKEKASDIPETAKIIHNLADAMIKRTPQPTDTPADLIKEQVEKGGLLAGRNPNTVVQAASPKKDGVELPRLNQLPPILIDGHEFKRTNIPHLDAITVIMYIVGEVLSDDPRIKDILRQIEFTFPDANGKLVYPKQSKRQPRRVKAKKRNVRPTK
jgi:hypothetical protein